MAKTIVPALAAKRAGVASARHEDSYQGLCDCSIFHGGKWCCAAAIPEYRSSNQVIAARA
jgi:hypothetical protein